MFILIEISNINMNTSNTKNCIKYFFLIFGLLVSYTSVDAQNDTIKKETKKFTTFLDAQKKADGITISIPEKTNPLFDLNKTKAIAFPFSSIVLFEKYMHSSALSGKFIISPFDYLIL